LAIWKKNKRSEEKEKSWKKKMTYFSWKPYKWMLEPKKKEMKVCRKKLFAATKNLTGGVQESP